MYAIRSYYDIRGNMVYRSDRQSAVTFYNSALSNLKLSSDIAPRYGKLNLLLAEVYLRLGQTDTAVNYAKKSLDSNKIV